MNQRMSKLLPLVIGLITLSVLCPLMALASVEMPNDPYSTFGDDLTGPLAVGMGNGYSIAMICFFLLTQCAAPFYILWKYRQGPSAQALRAPIALDTYETPGQHRAA